jgi:hypothetical protein
MARTLTPAVFVTMLRPPPRPPSLRIPYFDCGVGDDINDARGQMRLQIATGIRQAARLNDAATSEMRALHRLAAAIVETARTGR